MIFRFGLFCTITYEETNLTSTLPPVLRPITMSTVILSSFLVLASLLLSNPTSAAETSAIKSLTSSQSDHVEQVAISDTFGRDTPRSTVLGFISALSENDHALASNFINLSESKDPIASLRQFKEALDAGGRFHPDLQISNSTQGDVTDQLPPNQERVGSIKIEDKKVPLLLEKVVSEKGGEYWQFSNETLRAIPNVLQNSKPTLIERYPLKGLEDEKIFGYLLTDLIAAIVLTISSFIVTYAMVWLGYHLLNLAHQSLRNKPLPLANRVIMPLAVVIMALTLSELMVYAGLSVTLREPVNRFTEIASWLAMTWLLLRLVDIIFNHAIHLSYQKNYIERISIIGLLSKLLKALLLILAIIFIFGNLGFDLTTGIAALGIGGLALALGAQKTIENLVGSVVVVADSPVRIGDYCKFSTYEGTVVDIGIRSSKVRTLSRTIVTVPNGIFSSIEIENFSSRDMFRLLHNLYIERNTNINLLLKMLDHLSDFLTEHSLTNEEWNQVYILELRQDCYVIQLQAYIDASNAREFYKKQNLVIADIINQMDSYNIKQALPTQQLVIGQQKDENTAEKYDS